MVHAIVILTVPCDSGQIRTTPLLKLPLLLHLCLRLRLHLRLRMLSTSAAPH